MLQGVASVRLYINTAALPNLTGVEGWVRRQCVDQVTHLSLHACQIRRSHCVPLELHRLLHVAPGGIKGTFKLQLNGESICVGGLSGCISELLCTFLALVTIFRAPLHLTCFY